jgi:dTDP-4-dehydrorhamnose reductase
MKILVTGANGMLGKTLVPRLQKQHTVVGIDVADADITVAADVQRVINDAAPDLVIHGAAYTAVDKAETDQDTAYKVNRDGTENIAVACKQLDIPMLYISTDYVFDGKGTKPYLPTDPACPISVYGKSKFEGEEAVRKHLKMHYIVRTSWLYGHHGNNFVETMLKLAKTQPELKVVEDQFGSPTSTESLANIIAELMLTRKFGTYHATDGGTTTWCDFAREILKTEDVKVVGCTTEEFPRPAPRPRYSVLDKTSLEEAIGRPVVPWQKALQNYLNSRLQMQPA